MLTNANDEIIDVYEALLTLADKELSKKIDILNLLDKWFMYEKLEERRQRRKAFDERAKQEELEVQKRIKRMQESRFKYATQKELF